MDDRSVALVGAGALAGVFCVVARSWWRWRAARALMLRKMAEIRDGVRV